MDAKKFYLKNFWEERGYDEDFNDLIIVDEGTQWLTNPKFDFHSVSASAGINYMYGDHNSLLANVSIANRAPNAVELFSDGLHHSAAIIELGDLSFGQETSLKFSLSSSHINFLGLGDFAVSPYISRINNFIYLEPAGVDLTVRGAFPVWEYIQTDALLYGVDFDYKKEIFESFTFNTGISYIYGQDTEADEPLISIPATNFRSSLTYQKNKWNVTLSNTSVLKQERFPDNDFGVNIIRDNTLVTEIVPISETPAAYSIFDVSCTYDLDLHHNKNLAIGLAVTNMFDRSYRDYLNRQRFYADNVGRNISLNINLNF